MARVTVGRQGLRRGPRELHERKERSGSAYRTVPGAGRPHAGRRTGRRGMIGECALVHRVRAGIHRATGRKFYGAGPGATPVVHLVLDICTCVVCATHRCAHSTTSRRARWRKRPPGGSPPTQFQAVSDRVQRRFVSSRARGGIFDLIWLMNIS